MSNAGTHLIGAATYTRWATFWPSAAGPFAKPMNEIPKIVFSNSLASADSPETTIAAGDLAEAVSGSSRSAPADTCSRKAGRGSRGHSSRPADRRVPACRASGRPGRGGAALRHTADHQAHEHHRLQPRSRRPRLRGAPVIVPEATEASPASPDPVVRNYTLTAASHSSKLGPASFAPGLGSTAPSA